MRDVHETDAAAKCDVWQDVGGLAHQRASTDFHLTQKKKKGMQFMSKYYVWAICKYHNRLWLQIWRQRYKIGNLWVYLGLLGPV